MLNINNLRKEYRSSSLDIKDLHADPFAQFAIWFEEALKAKVLEPNAMILATANRHAQPSSRAMLLKGMDKQGFLFYTNYESRKGHELEENPQASATFLWKELERQITIEGTVEKLTKAESQLYFASRPRGSQLSAWASKQGRLIPSRHLLEEEYRKLEKQFENQMIPLPPYWGGYRLIPNRFEFWQGRYSRLHDRFQYLKQEETWHIDRLSP